MSDAFNQPFEISDGYDGAVIKVLGVGGGGQNAIDYMISEGAVASDEIEYMCLNTDSQALRCSKANTILQLGEQLTKGLGAGANPDIGREAAEEDRERIKEAIQSADMLFITAGMGGGTGTGAAPVIAEIAKSLNILTVAVVTRPFVFEGQKRMRIADEGLKRLCQHVDSLIVIPNNKLLSVLGKSVSLLDAFKAANRVLQGAVQGIADLITRPGLINVDFADVRTVMSEMGMAMMGTGDAAGEDRARRAAESAISSPLLEDIDLNGAKGVLVNITAGLDMTIGEFEVVGDTIRTFTSEDATVVVGTVIDPEMSDDLRVTVVVTGLVDQSSSTGKLSSRVAPASLVDDKASSREKAAEGSNHADDDSSAGGSGLEADPQDYSRFEQPTMVRQNNSPLPADGELPNYDTMVNEGSKETKNYFDIPTFLRRGSKENDDSHVDHEEF